MQFGEVSGTWVTDGHGHSEQDLTDGLAAALATASGNPTQAQTRAELAGFCETWYSDEFGFGHDCNQHQDVDRSLWSPGCGSFLPVTIGVGVPAAQGVERVEGGGQ